MQTKWAEGAAERLRHLVGDSFREAASTQTKYSASPFACALVSRLHLGVIVVILTQTQEQQQGRRQKWNLENNNFFSSQEKETRGN